MNKSIKLMTRLGAITQIFALVLLTGCATVGNALGSTSSAVPATACHATGDPSNPYEVITFANDISPVPASGCPTGPVLISNGMIAICHATGNETAPYDEVTVSLIGLGGHDTHEGDVFPATEGGCPVGSEETVSSTDSTDKITICHATGSKKNSYVEITVSTNGLNGHDKHDGDIIPAPEGGCPVTK